MYRTTYVSVGVMDRVVVALVPDRDEIRVLLPDDAGSVTLVVTLSVAANLAASLEQEVQARALEAREGGEPA